MTAKYYLSISIFKKSLPLATNILNVIDMKLFYTYLLFKKSINLPNRTCELLLQFRQSLFCLRKMNHGVHRWSKFVYILFPAIVSKKVCVWSQIPKLFENRNALSQRNLRCPLSRHDKSFGRTVAVCRM